jgi:predicted AlkP superfamily phosphohydrolase/phosphomutase
MRTLVLGFDAFDPVVFERLSGQGKLLTRYADAGGYARFAVADPPQSEVSWTSIATGLNPGGHGIFDFVHRDPATYALTVSLLPTKQGVGGVRFAAPFRARTFWDQAARKGFPATVLWWPATFPAQLASPVRTLPGLGTPDIRGRLGVGAFFSTDVEWTDGKRKTPVEALEKRGEGRFSGLLRGPIRKTRAGPQETTLQLQIDVIDDRSARLLIDNQSVELVLGKWSSVLELPFRAGRFLSVWALTRAILTRIQPSVQLYFLPLQIHPLHPLWEYASPRGLAKQVWNVCGPFLTLGWPQDTTGLEDGCITEDQFLDLCTSIFRFRECVLMHHLDHFREGVLSSVFDSLDRIQHMFWRDRFDVVEEWYVKLDSLLGRVEQRLAERGRDQIKIVLVSDHGFTDFNYKVHLNRWLVERGYLVTTGKNEEGGLHDVDWSQSRAYAVGLNSLYINVAGREGQGCVPAGGYEGQVNEIRDDLLHWQGPDGRPVVEQARCQAEAFAGPYTVHGPDIVVGYSRGYRASAETGLGKWEPTSLQPNRDHWGADHCMNARAVPGVLFCNQSLKAFPSPSYQDVAVLTIGMELDANQAAPPPPQPLGNEDEGIIEERLRGLGYL